MFTLLIAVVCGVTTGLLLGNFTEFSLFWTSFIGVFTFLVIQVSVGLLMRKKINAATQRIQNTVLAGQEKIRKKINLFQQKPHGGVKAMQRSIEKDQARSIQEALELTSILEPFSKWTLLLDKQISTMRFQFNYQLKNFDKADEFMKKALFMEPISVAMKVARLYKNDDPSLEKYVTKKLKKYKDAKGTLLYALYSWILVKEGRVDEAIVLLSRAKDLTGSETLARNWESLANGKIKKFSNAGLGDEWYALYLEEPKAVKTKMKQARGSSNKSFF